MRSWPCWPGVARRAQPHPGLPLARRRAGLAGVKGRPQGAPAGTRGTQRSEYRSAVDAGRSGVAPARPARIGGQVAGCRSPREPARSAATDPAGGLLPPWGRRTPPGHAARRRRWREVWGCWVTRCWRWWCGCWCCWWCWCCWRRSSAGPAAADQARGTQAVPGRAGGWPADVRCGQPRSNTQGRRGVLLYGAAASLPPDGVVAPPDPRGAGQSPAGPGGWEDGAVGVRPPGGAAGSDHGCHSLASARSRPDPAEGRQRERERLGDAVEAHDPRGQVGLKHVGAARPGWAAPRCGRDAGGAPPSRPAASGRAAAAVFAARASRAPRESRATAGPALPPARHLGRRTARLMALGEVPQRCSLKLPTQAAVA